MTSESLPRWVVAERGRRASAIGLHVRNRKGLALVQFGADGPFDLIDPRKLRAATEREIERITGQRP